MQDPYGLFFGMLFVLVYAYERFNTPATNRSSTTWLRYRTSAFLYLAASLLLFLFLAKVLEFSPKSVSFVLPPSVVETLQQPTENAGNRLTFSYYLLSALCLTILLAKTPGLRQVDDFIRACFQRCGAIPFQVDRLSCDLRHASFTLPSEQRAGLMAHLGADALKLQDAPNSQTELSWLRLHSMRTSLDTLSRDRHYLRFFIDFKDMYSDVKAHLDAVDDDAIAYVRLQAKGPLRADGLAGEILEKHRLGVQAALESALDRAYMFTARAILTCERTKTARLARLKRLGFALQDTGAVRINYDRMALLLVGLTSLIATVALISIHFQDTAQQLVLSLRHALQIAIVVWAAILWAVLIKRTGDWARPDKETEAKPYTAYVLAGALAVLTQVAVYVVIKVMIVDDPRTVVEHLPRTIPWAPLVFFTAFLTSLQCDRQGRPEMRGQEAGVQAVVMALTASSAYQISSQNPSWAPTGFANHELWAYAAGGAVIGFLVGAVVPHWYRADNRGMSAAEGGRGKPGAVSGGAPAGTAWPATSLAGPVRSDLVEA